MKQLTILNLFAKVIQLALTCLVLTISSKASAEGGKRYAIVVGINSYDHFRPLHFCVDDATEMAKVLGQSGWKVDLMLSMESTSERTRPTPKSILEAFSDIAKDAGPDDSFLFYFCGHGFAPSKSSGYLALSSTLPTKAEATALSVADLVRASGAIKCHEKAFFFDACRNSFKSKSDRSLVVEDNGTAATGDVPEMSSGLFKAFESISQKTSAAVFISCLDGKTAAELADLKHGVFTYVVLKGLSGGVVSPDGLVTANNLMPYIASEMKSIQPDQTPYAILAGSSTIVLGNAVKTQSTGININLQLDNNLRINHTTIFVDGDAAPVEEGFVSLKPGEHKINLVLEGPGVRNNGGYKYQSIRREFKIRVSKKHEFSYHVNIGQTESFDPISRRSYRSMALVEEKLLDGRKF